MGNKVLYILLHYKRQYNEGLQKRFVLLIFLPNSKYSSDPSCRVKCTQTRNTAFCVHGIRFSCVTPFEISWIHPLEKGVATSLTPSGSASYITLYTCLSPVVFSI